MNPDTQTVVLNSYVNDHAAKDYENRVLKAELEAAQKRIAELEAAQDTTPQEGA